MASTVSAWGKPGAWALDSEENEAAIGQQLKDDARNDAETADFPSLAVGAASKIKKKKKPQAIPIQEFNTYGGAKPQEFQAKGLTPDELFLLPTGPRERSAEELDRSRLGGGFRSYGGGLRDDQPRRQGGFNRDTNREFAPSRADESDSWGEGKRSSFNNGFERRERPERGGFFGDSQSRADEVDNWATSKSFVPSEPRRNERRVGFGFDSRNGGSDSDNWGRATGGFDGIKERRGGGFSSDGADSQSWLRKREEVSVGRPRLNLQPRTVPLGEGQKTETANVLKPKGSNPFGDARPREDVLKGKGQDWKEIDKKLDSMKLKEVSSVTSTDKPAVGKTNFWSGNRMVEDNAAQAWRRPGSSDSRPKSSAGESDNGSNVEKGDAQVEKSRPFMS